MAALLRHINCRNYYIIIIISSQTNWGSR